MSHHIPLIVHQYRVCVHVVCEHNKGYVGPRLKSSLQKVCGRRHELVDVKKYPLLKRLLSYKKQELLTRRAAVLTPGVLVGSVLLNFFRLYAFTFLVSCCDVRYDFLIKQCSVRLSLVVCRRSSCLFVCMQWFPTPPDYISNMTGVL